MCKTFFMVLLLALLAAGCSSSSDGSTSTRPKIDGYIDTSAGTHF